jgi:hypothetical protein
MRQQVNKQKTKAKITKMDDPRNVGASNMKSIKLVNQMFHTYPQFATYHRICYENFELNFGLLGLGCYISTPSTVQSYWLTADP